MKDTEVVEQFRSLRHATLLAGAAVETLKRDQRAVIDALRWVSAAAGSRSEGVG